MKENYSVTIGEVLRLFRFAQDGWTCAIVAQKVNVTHGHISRIERNEKNPSKELLDKFSKLYNIPVSEFFRIEKEAKEKQWNYQKTLREVLETCQRYKEGQA